MSQEERELLERIASRLEALEAKVGAINLPPRALKQRDAARMLGCSTKVLKAMIAKGECRTVTIGEREHVPMGEIVRITTIKTASKHPAPVIPRPRDRATAKSEAEKIRALARRRD